MPQVGGRLVQIALVISSLAPREPTEMTNPTTAASYIKLAFEKHKEVRPSCFRRGK